MSLIALPDTSKLSGCSNSICIQGGHMPSAHKPAISFIFSLTATFDSSAKPTWATCPSPGPPALIYPLLSFDASRLPFLVPVCSPAAVFFCWTALVLSYIFLACPFLNEITEHLSYWGFESKPKTVLLIISNICVTDNSHERSKEASLSIWSCWRVRSEMNVVSAFWASFWWNSLNCLHRFLNWLRPVRIAGEISSIVNFISSNYCWENRAPLLVDVSLITILICFKSEVWTGKTTWWIPEGLWIKGCLSPWTRGKSIYLSKLRWDTMF